MAQVVEIAGLIDLHVHLREPGFEYKETIETGLKAAKKGGFCAVCPMPNTNPAADNKEVIKFILNKAKNYNFDIYPIAAITKNLNSLELVNFKELKNAGAVGFSNDGLPLEDKETFIEALKQEELILSHCEYETKEIDTQISLFEFVCKKGYNPRLHFCHVSKKESIDLIRKAKNKGLKISAETAPHYFTFTKDNVCNNGIFKMNPPLGGEKDKESIIEALFDNTIDCIATDHAPHSTKEKLKPYLEAPNGIIGLETAFSLTYELLGLEKTLEKLAYNPRKILRIKNDKKVKIDLDKTYIYNAQDSYSKCKVSCYSGMELKGRIINE